MMPLFSTDFMTMKHTSEQFIRRLCASLVILALMPLAGPALTGGGYPASNVAAATQATAGDGVEIRADAFGLPLAGELVAGAYGKPCVKLQAGTSVQFEAVVEQAGTYTVAFDVAVPADVTITPPEGALLVDGALPFPDAGAISFPLTYENAADVFPLDRYGNEILMPQQRLERWSRAALRDAAFGQPYPLQLNLTAGRHTFDFTLNSGTLLLGSVYLEPFAPYEAYEQYRTEHPAADASGVLIELEAEFPTFKNDTSVRPVSSRSLDVTPYDTYRLLLNTLGGESWERSGSAVYYEFAVPQDGMYVITLRALQDYKNNFTVFRRITVNGDVPFVELNAAPFRYSTRWANLPLGGDIPYRIYLRRGVNVLGIETTVSPYDPSIERIRASLRDIMDLSLEIKKLTGNQFDIYKEWEIADYIPDIVARLAAMADALRADKQMLMAVNQSAGSQEVLAYQMAIDNLDALARDPNKIPTRMNRLSEGSGSATQLLGSILPSLQSQPLALDKIYIHSPDVTPPDVHVPATTALSEGLKRFARSFRRDPYQEIGAAPDEIEVWVNRPRQYVDLLQALTDERFTSATGIKVKFSIMPNESKLALACAAGIQPDVALGVSTNIPYELAIRNALMNLRGFDDFDRFIRIYTPGSLLHYIIDDAVYAIPEAQDFWVTYYRKDIMASLGLPIPRTWNEALEILPELQRYGLNFNTPLSSGSGLKGYLITAPYIFNQGASLYDADGLSGLSSEAAIQGIRFMAESFTVYGMPLTTANFYDSFRYGNLPIGVSNFETYLKLLTAAPEVEGLWDIDLYPATVAPDGQEYRYATGSAQAALMFANTNRPSEAWTFMKWWMSTETQVAFQEQLIMNYGLEYLWNSANVEAFRYAPIPQRHKDVILEQWEWLQEPVKLPGSYMQERELSNVWNRIVFDGVNPRVAIDASITIIDREILRKMEEFGYTVDGVRVRDVTIPSIEMVKGWMADDD